MVLRLSLHSLVEAAGGLPEEGCYLLGDVYGYAIQALLGIIAMASLLLKWWWEEPRRDFFVFCRDVSKQVVGGFAGHFINIFYSWVLVRGTDNECVFYFANFMSDLLIGLAITYTLIEGSKRMGAAFGTTWFDSGNYGNPPDNRIWLFQIFVWVVIVVLAKIFILFAIMLPLREEWYQACAWVLQAFAEDPEVELLMVMVIIPLFLNIFTFWVLDNWLKGKIKVNFCNSCAGRNKQPKIDADSIPEDQVGLLNEEGEFEYHRKASIDDSTMHQRRHSVTETVHVFGDDLTTEDEDESEFSVSVVTTQDISPEPILLDFD